MLIDALSDSSPQTRPLADDADRYRYLPFFEAYFSNFIEGTEFEVDEAARIVFDGDIPANRPADAHDILGTYRLLADHDEMTRTGDDADDFIDLVRAPQRDHHGGSAPKRIRASSRHVPTGPAQRTSSTRSSSNETVAAGFVLRASLDTAWEGVVYMTLVVTEVHPFADGNGRTAHAVMSAELTAGHEPRIIIATHRGATLWPHEISERSDERV